MLVCRLLASYVFSVKVAIIRCTRRIQSATEESEETEKELDEKVRAFIAANVWMHFLLTGVALILTGL